jgi:hypothetical protein
VRQELVADHSPPSSAESRKSGAIPPLPVGARIDTKWVTLYWAETWVVQPLTFNAALQYLRVFH